MKEKGVTLVIYGDDITVMGYDEALDWFRERIVNYQI